MIVISLLKDQRRVRQNMRPRTTRCIQDQIKSPLYVTILIRLPQQVRHRGHHQIEEQIKLALWDQI